MRTDGQQRSRTSCALLWQARACGALLALALACGASPARAQVALEQFKPAPVPSDGFALSRPEGLGHLEFAALLHLDYGHDPLVLRDASGNESSIIQHHLVGHVALSLGLFDQLTLFVGTPVQLMQEGDLGTGDGAGLGDAWLGARFAILHGAERRFALGAEFVARLPTAEWSDERQGFSGDEIGSYDFALLSELRVSRLALGLRPGVRLRKAQSIDAQVEIGHELLFGAYAHVRLVDALALTAELYGNSPFDSFFVMRATPIEVLFGARASFANVLLGAAAGPGLTRGYGTPEWRVVGTLGYTLARPKEAEPTDGDGDGVLDGQDACPDKPEDPDGYRDADGCPDTDNDGDGILDAKDACPDEPEDPDAFADDDGCLDADNDGDELLDPQDKCPLETEDNDGFEDQDGCLDRDNDGDGLHDAQDRCPNEAGPAEHQGCPPPPEPEKPAPPPVAVLEKGEIKISQRIEFAVNKDTILPESTPVLEAVQRVLLENPEVKVLRVEGHTDSKGGDKKNMELSRKRAASVARWLIAHGIPADRLSASGCGPKRPLMPNITPSGRKKNRRVEFHVIDPAPSEPVNSGMCRSTSVE